MEQQGSVEVVPGLGIVGDRYALHTGTWSNPKWPDQELTLFAAEVAEAMERGERGTSFVPPLRQAIAHHMLAWWLER